MPAARYWRIVGVETYAGGDLELAELHIYSDAGRADAAATLSSSMAPIEGALAALQDDDLATTCRFAGDAVRSSGFCLVWDFGVGNAVEIVGLRIAAASSASVFLHGCTLQYSQDGASWLTELSSIYYEFPGEFLYTYVPFGDPYFKNVIALLGFEDGVVDATGRVWTVRGSEAIVRPESALLGEKGLRVDGLDSSLDTTTQLDISGATPVTIEGFMRIASYTGPKMPSANLYRQSIFGQSGNSGAQDQMLVIENGKVLLYRDSYCAGSRIDAVGVNLVPLNEKFHFEYSFDGTRARVFINGVKEIDVASANGWVNTGYPFRIGSVYNLGYPQYRAGANADFDEIRITAGVARHTDSFTPPDEPFPRIASGGGGIPPFLRANGTRAGIWAASSPLSSHTLRQCNAPNMACDIEFGGTHCIYGTVEQKLTGDTTLPLKRRVRLHRSRDGLLVRETWSDAQGNYRFDGLSTRYEYDVIAWDHEGQFRSTIANNLKPEVLP